MSSFNQASTIGFEEPENGVHPRRLSVIAQMLYNAAIINSHIQALVTTHSPKLPGFLNPEADYSTPVSLVICAKRGDETKFEYLHTGPLLVEKDAEDALDENYGGALEEILMRGDFGG